MRNDRWSTPPEIRRALTPDTDKSQGGPILYYKNGRYLKYTGEKNTLITGTTGTGKTRCCTINLLNSQIDAEESFVAVDSKGVLYAHTAHRLGKKYRKIVIDFRHVFRSARCNILAAPTELYRSGDPEKRSVAMEMIDDIAHTLYPLTDDPFWPGSARDILCAASYLLMEIAGEEEINMLSVYRLLSDGDNGVSPGGCQMLRKLVESLPADSLAATFFSYYLHAPTETRSSMRSVFLQGLSLFIKNEGLISMMASDDLCINRLDGKTPTAIYFILPDETPIYNPICAVLIGQLMTHYIRLAQEQPDGRLPRRMNFLVEEAGNIGRIGPLSHLMSAGRSRNVRVQLVIQNYSQLNTLYGDAEADTIRSNADVLIAFRTNHWDTLTELSNQCGERDVMYGGRASRERLITPSQLASMKTGMALVIVSGSVRFITQMPDCSLLWPAPERMLCPGGDVCRKPVKVFRIGEYLQSQEEKAAQPPDEKRRREPVRNLAAGGCVDISRLMENVEKKIAELEAAEDAAPATTGGAFRITVRGSGGSLARTVRAIQVSTGMPPRQVLEKLRKVPFLLTFESVEEARAAAGRFREAEMRYTVHGFEE